MLHSKVKMTKIITSWINHVVWDIEKFFTVFKDIVDPLQPEIQIACPPQKKNEWRVFLVLIPVKFILKASRNLSKIPWILLEQMGVNNGKEARVYFSHLTHVPTHLGHWGKLTLVKHWFAAITSEGVRVAACRQFTFTDCEGLWSRLWPCNN